MCCQFQLLWLVHVCQVGVIALLYRSRNIPCSLQQNDDTKFATFWWLICPSLSFSCVFCHTRTPLSYVVGFNYMVDVIIFSQAL
jgi:hypothetical protein